MRVRITAFYRITVLVFAVCSAALLSVHSAEAQATIQHSGNSNPVLEGWARVDPVAGDVVAGPVMNDIGSGFDAWFVDDNSTAGGSYMHYEAAVSSADIASGENNGWTLRARLRVVDSPDTPAGSVFVTYHAGSYRFAMLFGAEADGDPTVTLDFGGPSFVLSGSGGGYHLYELIFDPVTKSVDLLVDGVERISNFPGIPTTLSAVAWGAASSTDTGRGNYNLVQLSIGQSAQLPQGPSLNWVRQFGSSFDDTVNAVAVRGLRVAAAGANGGYSFVRLYDSTGVLLWSHDFRVNSNDVARAVAIDGLGNVYVGGHTGPLFGFIDAYLRAYDINGNLKWTHQYGTSGHDWVSGLAVDALGNVSAAAMVGGESYDINVRQYDVNGSLMWNDTFGSSAVDEATRVAIDTAGNVLVTGGTFSALPGQTSAGNKDIFIRKYTAGGLVVWTKQFGTPSSETAYAITTDADNNVIVGGITDGNLAATQAGSGDAFVRKLNPMGDVMWTRQFGGPSPDGVFGTGVDLTGNVFATGHTADRLGQASFGLHDVYIRKFDPAATTLWTYQFGTSSSENVTDGVTDAAGNVYLGGRIYGGVFPGETSSGGVDGFVARVSASDPIESSDKIAPTITAASSPAANGSGWNNSDATVTFSATDNAGGSGVKEIVYSINGGSPVTIPGVTVPVPVTSEGTFAFSFFARDNAGNASQSTSLTIRIDTTAPAILATLNPPANSNGWNKTDVSVTFECSDNLSRVATCSSDYSINAEGTTTVTGVVTDVAGNVRNYTHPQPVRIDKTPPEVFFVSPIGDSIVSSSPTSVVVRTADFTDVASVFINGMPATRNGGMWQALVGVSLPVQAGSALVFQAAAIDIAGNSAVVQQRVDNDGIAAVIDSINGSDQSAFYSDNYTKGSTSGAILTRGGWTVSMIDVIGPSVVPDPRVQATISGNGSMAKIRACGGSYKEIDLDRNGESATWNCSSTGTLNITANNAQPNIEIFKQFCTRFGCGWFDRISLRTGNTLSTGSPITAHADNTDPVAVELTDDKGVSFGSFQVDPGESVDVDFRTGPNGVDVVDLKVLSGSVTFTIGTQTVTLGMGETRTFSTDVTPPAIAATVTGPTGNNGWYVGNVNVSWEVFDPESPTQKSGCDTVVINRDTAGETLTCIAQSDGGTSSKSVTIKRDATAPQMTCRATPDVLWPPNNQFVPVTITVSITDGHSGSGSFRLVSITNNETGTADTEGFTVGTASVSGRLKATRLGSGSGRIYSLLYNGFDIAGNSSSCTATVTVPHDQGKK